MVLKTYGETRGGFIEHLSVTYVAQLIVTKSISLTIMNLVTPKAGAKHEFLSQLLGHRELLLKGRAQYS
jgi:hypothetical protein